MERVAYTALGAVPAVPESWVKHGLLGLKWSLFAAAVWLVLVPLQVCLQCAVGGAGWASALLLAVAGLLVCGFLWVDRLIGKRKRHASA